MDLGGRTCLVTGGQTGLGAALADALLAAGASTVVVTSRHPVSTSRPELVPLQLDVTDPASVEAAAQQAQDVSVLVNNAGVFDGRDLLQEDVDAVRRELDTNALGPLLMTRAFVPSLTRHERSALLNVGSLLSWSTYGDGYSFSKAAAWGLTNGLRALLSARGVLVTSLHTGFMDTPMVAAYDAPKHDPRDVARAAVSGLQHDLDEVLFDEASRRAKAALAGPPAGLISGASA
jgi:NAD(P)-dependent dehydrogenase (short-subunit alcohol dehydrogenase family)